MEYSGVELNSKWIWFSKPRGLRITSPEFISHPSHRCQFLGDKRMYYGWEDASSAFLALSIRCTLNLLGIAWKLCFHLHFWGCLGKAGRQVIPIFSLPVPMLYFVLFSVKNGWFCQMGIMKSRKMRVRWTFPPLMLPGAIPEPAETVNNLPATPVALLGV